MPRWTKPRSEALAFAVTQIPLFVCIGILDFLIPIKFGSTAEELPLIGALISAAWLASILTELTVGDITDKIGVKKTLLLGMLLILFGAFILAITDDLMLMTLGTFTYGLGYVAQSVPSTSYLWSHFPRWYRGSAIGWYSLFFATSYAAAPLIAAFLIFGYSLNLPAALAVVMSAAAILLAVHLRLGAGHEDFWRALKEAIRDDGIVVKEVRDMMHLSAKEIALLFNMFVFGFWWVTFQLGAPLLFFIGEGSLWEAAIFMAAFSLPFAAMDMCYGRLCNITKNRMRFLYLGMSISAALLVAFYFADNFLLLLLIGVAMVVSTDAAWVANEVHLGSHLPKGKKGEYTGVFLLGKELGYSFAPVFYGLFAVAGLKVPFLALGALMLIGWLFFSITHRFGRA